jgi:hypothetical protein
MLAVKEEMLGSLHYHLLFAIVTRLEAELL